MCDVSMSKIAHGEHHAHTTHSPSTHTHTLTTSASSRSAPWQEEAAAAPNGSPTSTGVLLAAPSGAAGSIEARAPVWKGSAFILLAFIVGGGTGGVGTATGLGCGFGCRRCCSCGGQLPLRRRSKPCARVVEDGRH